MPIIKRGKVEIIEVIPDNTKVADDDEVRKQIKESQEKKQK